MFIWGGRAPAMNGSFNSLRQYYLTDRDYQDILTECPDVKAATADIRRNDIRAVSDYYQSSGPVFGVLPNFTEIRYAPLASGRWLNAWMWPAAAGDRTGRRDAPGAFQRAPFSRHDHPAQRHSLSGDRISEARRPRRQQRPESVEFRALQTMREDFPMLNVGEVPDAISLLNYQPRSRALHEAAQVEVHKVIARNHGFDYANLDSYDEWDTIGTSDSVGKIFDAMNLFLGSVGLVTLALGAIGVINIMLVAVADRTREIGLRKALGATDLSIMFQFFVEGAFLTLLSGGLGMAGAATLMGLLSLLPSPPGWDTPRLVPWTAAAAIGFLAISGVIAGLYPARKAALLQPVEALRRE